MKRRHPLASIANPITLLLLLSLTLILQACGGGGGGPAATYKVGGTVAGLGDTPLILQNNGSGTLSVAQNGSYEFTTTLTEGTAYDVTILTQPDKYSCDISNGTGVVAKENIITINVNCSLIPTYTIGGSVTGLGSDSLVLQNNGSEQLTVSANGNYHFATALVEGTPYNVTILTQPSNYNCTLNGSNSGTVAAENITTVAINCGVVATGYYNTGSANVKTDNTNSTALAISDLRAMVNGNRMMLMSLGQELLYDATITVSGDAYSGEATIYKSGARISTTPVAISGTITGSSGITGTLTGSGVGNGTFELSYALSNSEPAALSRLLTTTELSYWGGAFYLPYTHSTRIMFKVDGSGGLKHEDVAIEGYFAGCAISDGSMTPVADKALYLFDVFFDQCYASEKRTGYTGFATNLTSSPDPTVGDLMLVAFSNGESAGIVEFVYRDD